MKNDKPGWSFALAVLERMAKTKEFSLFMSNFLVRLLQLLVCLGLPAMLMAAAPEELPGKDVTTLEEVVRPVSKARSQDLAQPQQPLPPLEVFDSLRHVAHRARRGDTLAKLFGRFGLPEREKSLWLYSVQKSHPIKGILAGKEVHFYFTKVAHGRRGQSEKEQLKALEIELNDDWSLTWEKGNQGIVFSKREKPYDVEVKTVQGVVENSFFEDGRRAGLHQDLISQLVDIFGWEIDFSKMTQKGDAFKVLYEERSRNGKKSNFSFRILAAELVNAATEYFAIYFENNKGVGRYYDLDGRALARAFLRFPLEFSSISSQFSHSRFNPILKVDMPHHGVDFAAKRGTFVRAIGDGKILHAGWQKGGYGRMIEIQHDSVYSSRYAHLQRLAPGLKTGATIRKGQIIGYVGSTGRSTGAHLHFELYKDYQYVDPLNFEIPREDWVEPSLRRVFENSKRVYLAELDSAPRS